MHTISKCVYVFFFASLKLLVQYFRQSVLLLQSFEFRWNNLSDFSFSLSRNFGYHLPSKNCSSDLIVRWKRGPLTSSVRIVMEFCTRELHFCRTKLPHHVCLSSIVPCYRFCESSHIVKKHSSIVPCYRFCESSLIVN